jgi:hypothetical protein
MSRNDPFRNVPEKTWTRCSVQGLKKVFCFRIERINLFYKTDTMRHRYLKTRNKMCIADFCLFYFTFCMKEDSESIIPVQA